MKGFFIFTTSVLFTGFVSAADFNYSNYNLAIGLKPEVLKAALTSINCAVKNGYDKSDRVAIIDFSKPSNEKRLWILDLKNGNYVLQDYVSHGVNSGNKYSYSFSNKLNSHQSSIGLFKGSESYYGKHGYSLRLDGLENGFNSNARERSIVIHSAKYMSNDFIKSNGRAGRSHGCPAVDVGVVKDVVDNLKGGQYVFKYYPDDKWLKNSSFLHCGA